MFAILIVFLGLVIAVVIAVGAAKLPDARLRAAGGIVAVGVLFVFFVAASVRLIGADEVGVVVKNVGTSRLKGGAYIAVNGEQGIQADVLEPGWHFWYWPFIYDVRETPLTEVRQGDVGILDAKDGLPLQPGQVIADEWSPATQQQMLDARYFLTTGQGQKGTQATVLTPGKYRLNPELFKVTMAKQTEVPHGEVAVLKANFGKPPSLRIDGPAAAGAEEMRLADEHEMGVRAKVLPPGKYAINTQAYTVVEIWTTQMIAHYAAASAAAPSQRQPGATHDAGVEEREITVRTSDGFTFPVDVRIEYEVKPEHAPVVVAKLGDDEEDRFRNALNSAVRAIFRNNAETVRALDYVQQRSNQEQQSLQMLAEEMARFGVTVTAVRIGNVGDEKTLGNLLKTQTDREIAKQEQLTFQEQQKAAEQKKLLSRATQESEEEKRLATAAYAAKIADEEKKKRLIEAEAEAQSIAIKAKAQADAYELIAGQIGKANAAMIEVLKIVGERNIQITPRVMISGGGANAGSASGAALFGTMLDTMVSREEEKPPPARTP